MKQFTVFLFFLILFTGLFFSCTGKQYITLNPDMSGQAELNISLQPMFVKYVEDIYEGIIEDDVELNFFDKDSIRQQLADYPGLKMVDYESNNFDYMKLKLSFADLKNIFPTDKGQKPILDVVPMSNNRNLIVLHIDLDNVQALLDAMPEELVENNALLPDPDHPVSYKEYEELFLFIFEEYEGQGTIKHILNKMGITIELSGLTVLSQTGGKLENGKASLFIPLIQLLALEKPVHWEVIVRSY